MSSATLRHQHVPGSSLSQTRGISPVIGGSRPLMLQGQGPRLGPQWQHRPRPHLDSRCHHWLLTSDCPSLPLSLQFCLSSLSPCPFVSLSLLLLHHSLAPLGGARVSECLGFSQERCQECYTLLMHYGTRSGSSWAWSAPQDLQSVRLVVISG